MAFARGHASMRWYAGVAMLAGACLAVIIMHSPASSPSVLVGRGVMYGFHPDEMAVAPTEEKRAMDTLVKSAGGKIMPADISARELKRWITPYFDQKKKERPDMYGNKRIPSAVDFENRRIDLISEAEPKVSQHFKAAYDNSLPVRTSIRKGTQPDFFSASFPEISAAKARNENWDQWMETAARPPKVGIHVPNQQADFFQATALKHPPRPAVHVRNQQADFFDATGHYPTYESATEHERQPAKIASLVSTAQQIFDGSSGMRLQHPPDMLSAAQRSLDSRSYAARARFEELAAPTPEQQITPAWGPPHNPDREQGYDGEGALEEPDAFAPHEPWNTLPENKKMAFASADVERECSQAGKGYSWDAEGHQCLFEGAPVQAQASPEVRPLAYKYQDLKHDCEQRGPEYRWQEAEVDGEVGDCYKFKEKLKMQDKSEQRWQSLDYFEADRKSACEKRGWVWANGDCSEFGRGLADQDGYRKEVRTERRKSGNGWMFMDLPSKWDAIRSGREAETPATQVGGTELPFTFADFKSACDKKQGVYKLIDNPPRAVCLSQWECSVIDQNGAEDHNCERAGLANLWATHYIQTNPARAMHRDKFNPGGSQEKEDTGRTPPLSIASSVWQAQTGAPNPLPFQNTDLHGKDLGRFVQAKPEGSFWTSGTNHANGESDKYFYNHATDQLVWKGPMTRPEQCTDEVNGTGEVKGCNWERNVDLSSGEYYWKNLDSGATTWDNPFEDKYPAAPKLAMTTRKGTWSGTRGGNAYWTPVRAEAELGPNTRVFSPFVKRLPNCGGSSGMCMGYAEGGSGPAEPPDAFNPQSEMRGEPLRGVRGAEWDRAAAQAKEGGEQKKGRVESLADIYGVRVDDDDAHKFFEQDDSANKELKPSHASTIAYVRYLAKHPYKPANGQKDGEGTAVKTLTDADFEPEEPGEEGATKWPEAPKFGLNHKGHSREEWCKWEGGGGLPVRCSIGMHGAWPDEPVSRGIWGKTEENKHTMVGWGAWKIPKAAIKRRQRVLPKGALHKLKDKAWRGQQQMMAADQA